MNTDRTDPGDEGTTRDQRIAWEEQYESPHPVWRGPGEVEPGLPADGHVLELGCGNGKTLAALGPRHGLIVGVDFSRNALRTCGRLEGSMAELRLVQADMLDLPFPDGLFDLVLCYHVLDHALAAERGRAAREIVRVTRPAGAISFRGFAAEDLRAQKGSEVEPRTYARGRGLIYHYFDGPEVGVLFPGTRLAALEKRSKARRFRGRSVERVEIGALFIRA